MTESRLTRVLLRIASGGVLVFLYLPLVIIAIYAFNSGRLQSWPPQGFSVHWFQEALENRNVIRAVTNSLIAATFATAIALVLGTLASVAVHRYSFFGRQTISFLLVLPIALPGVVTGIALRQTFTIFDVDFGLMTIVVGHATFCVVVVYNNVIARLRRLPVSPEEASADLGGDPWTTFRRVTGPRLGTALMAGALLSFALSFDEIIVTLFTAGARDADDPAVHVLGVPAYERAAGRERPGVRADPGQRDPGVAGAADQRRGGRGGAALAAGIRHGSIHRRPAWLARATAAIEATVIRTRTSVLIRARAFCGSIETPPPAVAADRAVAPDPSEECPVDGSPRLHIVATAA